MPPPPPPPPPHTHKQEAKALLHSDPGRYFHNDVWSTADGVEWRQDCAECPWEPRSYHDIASYDGKLWVLAGSGFGGKTLEEMKCLPRPAFL
eukprot:COSAG06_NODE_676_length_13150_cov_3.664164_8_plen_92_part_00